MSRAVKPPAPVVAFQTETQAFGLDRLPGPALCGSCKIGMALQNGIVDPFPGPEGISPGPVLAHPVIALRLHGLQDRFQILVRQKSLRGIAIGGQYAEGLPVARRQPGQPRWTTGRPE